MVETHPSYEVQQNTQIVDKAEIVPWVCLEQQLLPPISDFVKQGKQNVTDAIENRSIWTLPGTGFSVASQMQRLFDAFEIHEPATVEEFKNQIAQWTDETIVDVISFQLEYLSDRLVYPIQLAKDETGEIVCPNYGNAKYIDIVQENEREGVVKQSAQKIVNFLKTAKPESLAFFTSPPGWSGLTTDTGKSITFPDTQTYLFRVKNDGGIESATVQTNMSVDENKQLLELFGGEFDEHFQLYSSREKIKSITGTVIQFDAEIKNPDMSFKKIAEQIQTVVGSDITSKGSVFESIYNDLHHIDTLMETDRVTQDELQRLRSDMTILMNQVINGTASLAVLGERIGYTVLTIAAHAQIEKNRRKYAHTGQDTLLATHAEIKTSRYNNIISQENTLSFLQTLPGCNGGGSGLKSDTVVVNSAGVLRVGVVESESSTCQQCGEDSSDHHYHCPGCGERYADETDRAPENRTKQCHGIKKDGMPCKHTFGC